MPSRANRAVAVGLVALALLAGCEKRGVSQDGSSLSLEAQLDDFAQDLANNRIAFDEFFDRFDYSRQISDCHRTRAGGFERIACSVRSGDFDVAVMRNRWGRLVLGPASTTTLGQVCAATPIATAKRTVRLCARFKPVNDFFPDAYDSVERATREEGDAQDIRSIELEAF